MPWRVRECGHADAMHVEAETKAHRLHVHAWRRTRCELAYNQARLRVRLPLRTSDTLTEPQGCKQQPHAGSRHRVAAQHGET